VAVNVKSESFASWAIFCIVLLTAAYPVHRDFGWNENSRLALSAALAESGSFVIDQWHTATGDKAFRAGHYYTDKAIGLSLLGIVAEKFSVGVPVTLSRFGRRIEAY